jgi:hypothetical protein
MKDAILVLNAGSSSAKFAVSVVESNAPALELRGQLEGLFTSAHDGFCLYDLVAYNQKHNAANGHNNTDGTDDNVSWNCGWEGDVNAPAEVLALRRRQVKNFFCLLMLSNGTSDPTKYRQGAMSIPPLMRRKGWKVRQRFLLPEILGANDRRQSVPPSALCLGLPMYEDV